VRDLVAHGRVEERTRFGPASGDALVYAVATTEEAPAMTCSWSEGRLVVLVPRAVAATWSTGDALGLEASQPVADGATLRILVEKDLACVTPRAGEDDRDAFPNPAGCAR
jgi:hypothetical protein